MACAKRAQPDVIFRQEHPPGRMGLSGLVQAARYWRPDINSEFSLLNSNLFGIGRASVYSMREI
jgi:hypothetical protein